ncbi:MAG TPA: carbohydrate ABC transporter permease, partial [Chloroflexota bacterium]|nr:carbohydrate ABC transporter permease [Chloroflexota bacterium]
MIASPISRGPLHGVRVLGLYVLALLMAAFSLFPLIIALGTALKPPGTATSDLGIFPAHPSWSNFSYIFTETSLLTYVKNSVIVTTATTALVVAGASLAAYAFSRLTFFLKNVLYPLFLMGLMLPFVVVLVPLFHMEERLHLFNTYGALILPYVGFGLPFAILLLKNYFDSVPREMEEAALVDGASRLRTFLAIVLPMTTPALSTVAIFQTVGSWNEFLFALLFMTKDAMRTVPLAIVPFIG